MNTRFSNDTITAIDGIKVGHASNAAARTGCTVILCEAGAVAGVDVRGSAPGTRETDAIRPGGLVGQAHAILLTGGSAFGLDAAGGVMRYLEERGVGFPAGPVRVPIVPGAVIFDLGVGDAKVRPDRDMGYGACVSATSDPVEMGQIGAGAGATVGKAPGLTASNGGVGSACHALKSGLIVGAIVVVNALGNIVHPESGQIVTGAKHQETGEFVDLVRHMLDSATTPTSRDPNPLHACGTNTTIGVVATNASLSPTEITKVAQMAHDGLARTIRPVHTMSDGDTIFALSIGTHTAAVNTVGILAAEVVAQAVLRSVEGTM
ncbi:MAG: P1 family peptidase [Candidatus Poribacteria bacterium]|nr:P1 family peptidase [Candidatus Poribacteria bacterium]